MMLGEILKRAIKTYGTDHQIDKAIEEMSELTQALIKLKQSKNSHIFMDHVSEEMADVEIMIKQLNMILKNDEQVKRYRIYKLIRLKKRMDGDLD